MKSVLALFFVGLSSLSNPLSAQKTATYPPPSALTYADLADLALASALVAEVRIRSAEVIKGPLAINVPPYRQRYLLSAEVQRLIRGRGGIDPLVSYVFDAPRDSRGGLPKLKKAQMIFFAVPVANRPGEIRLVAPDAQIATTPEVSARIRAIISDASQPDAPPRVTGVGDAFHTLGQLQGEGETQIFLQTDDGRPMSFSVKRVQSAAPVWSVASGEIVDASAEVPVRGSFLWYRLACFLPANLPQSSVAALSVEDARIAGEDYRTVMTGLGSCPRSRINRP